MGPFEIFIRKTIKNINATYVHRCLNGRLIAITEEVIPDGRK